MALYALAAMTRFYSIQDALLTKQQDKHQLTGLNLDHTMNTICAGFSTVTLFQTLQKSHSGVLLS